MVKLYLITNLKNGKVYIGKTIRTIAGRWAKHLEAAACGRKYYISNAIRKYGKDGFTIEQIDCAETQEAANDLEKKYILQYQSHIPKLGYNCTLGGDGGTPNAATREKLRLLGTGRKHSLKTIEKMSKAKRGTRASEETKQLLSLQRMGNKWRLGILDTPETKKRKRDSHLGEKCYKYRKDLEDDAITSAYESGLTTRQIARQLKTGKTTVIRRLKLQGIKMRPTTRTPKQVGLHI